MATKKARIVNGIGLFILSTGVQWMGHWSGPWEAWLAIPMLLLTFASLLLFVYRTPLADMPRGTEPSIVDLAAEKLSGLPDLAYTGAAYGSKVAWAILHVTFGYALIVLYYYPDTPSSQQTIVGWISTAGFGLLVLSKLIAWSRVADAPADR